MKEKYKKVLGVTFIIVGLLALITPFTPGSWLVFVGAELLGLHWLSLRRFKGKKDVD